VPRTFVSYSVEDGRITGFRSISVEAPFEARSTPPTPVAFPSFSDPDGQRLLVRIETGPFAGIHVSPEDPGVTYQPGY